MIHTVIIAGGKGERFWPFSTQENPKQLLRIISKKSMLQETIERVADFVPYDRTVIVTGENLKEKILEQFDFFNAGNILGEPCGKNTCMAIGFAAAHLHQQDPEAIMVVLSADHYIKPKEKLLEVLRIGSDIAAREDVLITIGIKPTRPETGYGYIELGELFDTKGDISTFRVAQFKEKPDQRLAQAYYIDRSHLWNSGMFIWSTRAILKSLSCCKPEIHAALMEYSSQIGTPQEMEARAKLFDKCENISIDVAVLEQADNVLVIKAKLIWDDIGSWRTLERINPRDQNNNVIIGKVLLHDSFEVTAVNSSDSLVTTLGVSDLVIVKTDAAVLVAHKTRVNELRSLLERIREDKDLEKFL
ncbi:MAG: mannose-1-phosphate guanylyltransferase [candidate division Zixibacteria bacterium]|nr:mannose-1-phosphate guanylyltransferase [candidate division Zixibacteria bacterium]